MKIASISQAKSCAKKLTARLAELGVVIKNTQALEGGAAIGDYSDWNHCQAGLVKNSTSFIAETEQTQPHRIFLIPPGGGKTSMLQVLFADALARNEPAIWIDCSGCTPIPSFLADRLCVIDVAIAEDGGGSMYSSTPTVIDTAVWIRLPRAAQAGAVTKAIYDLMLWIEDSWPAALVKSLKLAVIDEAHRVVHSYLMLLLEFLPQLAGGALRVMAGTQYIDLRQVAASALEWRVITDTETKTAIHTDSAVDAKRVESVYIDRLYVTPPSLHEDIFFPEAVAVLVQMSIARRRPSIPQCPRGELILRAFAESSKIHTAGVNLEKILAELEDARILLRRQLFLDADLARTGEWQKLFVEYVCNVNQTSPCLSVLSLRMTDAIKNKVRDILSRHLFSVEQQDRVVSAIVAVRDLDRHWAFEKSSVAG